MFGFQHVLCLFLFQPPRNPNPIIWFSSNNVAPMLVESFPFDKYELEPSALTQHILAMKNPNSCWQVRAFYICVHMHSMYVPVYPVHVYIGSFMMFMAYVSLYSVQWYNLPEWLLALRLLWFSSFFLSGVAALIFLQSFPYFRSASFLPKSV